MAAEKMDVWTLVERVNAETGAIQRAAFTLATAQSRLAALAREPERGLWTWQEARTEATDDRAAARAAAMKALMRLGTLLREIEEV